MEAIAPKIVGPKDGKAGFLGSIGVRFMIDGVDADDRFSLVEHPMSPRALAAPLHRHTREDEYSYIVKGRMGALLGDEVVYAEAGDLVYKPRNQWHTFWNAGDEPAYILEIIARRLRGLLQGALGHGRRGERRPRGPHRSQRALRPRDGPGLDSGPRRAVRRRLPRRAALARQRRLPLLSEHGVERVHHAVGRLGRRVPPHQPDAPHGRRIGPQASSDLDPVLAEDPALDRL